ncbi:MAG: hypothetical protein AB7E70_19650 [Hyphomicrobiaceae bacterium]
MNERPLILRSALLAKLASEEFEMDSPRSAQDAAYTRGWNDRSKSLARFLRGELTNQCGEREEMEAAFAHDGEGG